MTVGSA